MGASFYVAPHPEGWYKKNSCNFSGAIMRDPVRYSDNLKMDTSGISATIKRYDHGLKPLAGKVIAGGEIYAEAIDEGNVVVTDPAHLKQIAGLVDQGYSLDHATDIVAKEVAYPEEEG